MDRVLDLAHRLARLGALGGGALTILAAIVIGVDVVLRKTLALSVGGASELSGYVLAIGSSWGFALALLDRAHIRIRSEEHTSELQSLMRISYAVFCLKKKKHPTQ